MREALLGLLPRILPHDIDYSLVTHEGKSDLEKSIPRKLRAMNWDGRSIFFVVRDNDAAPDCQALKAKLDRIASEAGTQAIVKTRLVMQCLESWFLGDLAAVEAAYRIPGLAAKQDRAKYRNCDRCTNARDLLTELVPGYGKVSGARLIGQYLDWERSRSPSFRLFVRTVRQLAARTA